MAFWVCVCACVGQERAWIRVCEGCRFTPIAGAGLALGEGGAPDLRWGGAPLARWTHHFMQELNGAVGIATANTGTKRHDFVASVECHKLVSVRTRMTT